MLKGIGAMRKNDLENYIEEYEKIVIFDCESKWLENLLASIQEYISTQGFNKKILMLHTTNNIILDMSNENVEIHVLSREDMDGMLQLYSTYEFSNRVILLTFKSQYPSMLNYLSQGILTEEEFIEALLH